MVKYGGVITSTQGTSFNIEKFCFLKTFLSVSLQKKNKKRIRADCFFVKFGKKAIRDDSKSRQIWRKSNQG